MSSPDALCVLIQVIELRNARLNPNETAVVRVRFNNDTQETAPSRGRFDHDIVWEMTTDKYKAFKATRQAFKLEAFSGSNKLGYLVIPLQEIRVNDMQSSWIALLQPPKLARPELLLRTRVVRADDYYREVADMQARLEAAALHQQKQPSVAAIASTPAVAVATAPSLSSSGFSSDSLDQSIIEIGTDGGFNLNLSIRIDSVSGLDLAAGPLYFFYQIFDSEVRFPPFGSMAEFRPQKRDFVLCTSKVDLLSYLDQPVELYLCTASTAIGAIKVLSLPALARRWFKSRANEILSETIELCPLTNTKLGRNAAVNVTFTMAGQQQNQDQDSFLNNSSVVFEPSSVIRVSEAPKEAPKNAPTSLGAEYAKLYRIQIRVASLKGLQPQKVLGCPLEQHLNACTEETWLYTRFAYPLLFGEAHVFSNPTCLVQRNAGGAMWVAHPQIGGALFSFEFAMSERNMRVALQEASIGVEVWRMAAAPCGAGAHGKPAILQEGQDKFIGVAVAPLVVLAGEQGTRVSLGDGEVCFSADQYFPIMPEMPGQDVQQPCIGHVQVCLQLNDLGSFEAARSRDQQLREQLETTRAKLEELWEEKERERKRADQLETRLLVAAFEEQIASGEEEQEQAKQLKLLQEKLREQRELNKECIAALDELEKENEELKVAVAAAASSAAAAAARSKRPGSISSPLIRKVHSNNQSPGSKRSVNRSLNITCENDPSADLSNMSSAPEAEMHNF